jgi:uncharacterized membrane protein HdeD (DUF308 family)
MAAAVGLDQWTITMIHTIGIGLAVVGMVHLVHAFAGRSQGAWQMFVRGITVGFTFGLGAGLVCWLIFRTLLAFAIGSAVGFAFGCTMGVVKPRVVGFLDRPWWMGPGRDWPVPLARWLSYGMEAWLNKAPRWLVGMVGILLIVAGIRLQYR